MILRRPYAVLHMAAKCTAADLPQPFLVIEEAEVLFDLNVTEVVPVTNMRRIQFVE